MGSKLKRALHCSACCPTTSFTTQRRTTQEGFTAPLVTVVALRRSLGDLWMAQGHRQGN